MSDFKAQLEEIQKEFKQEEHRTEKEFNIFNALYKKESERLHSRFISYLLSPDSRHGMGSSYLKLFIERLSKTYPNLEKFNIDDCTVIPNENDKIEHEKIDIYIQNNKSQAIIIENKIYAGDSNDPKKENPAERIQLIRYFKTVEADKKIKDIFVLYLTPDRHNPEEIEKIEMHFPVLKIDYPNEIIDWIDKCIEITNENKITTDNENQILKEILEQYKSVVRSFTNNLKRAIKLKELLDENIKEAWDEKKYISEEMDDFKHVKWHTIDEFWRELAQRLIKELKVEISKEINIKDITKVAHDKKGSTGINFKLYNGQEWYIVNDNKNGLSYGKILPDEGEGKKQWVVISENIKFTDFNNEETFMLINTKKREGKIEEIINKLKENPLLMKSKES